MIYCWDSRLRTYNLLSQSQMLYQLRYISMYYWIINIVAATGLEPVSLVSKTKMFNRCTMPQYSWGIQIRTETKGTKIPCAAITLYLNTLH